LPGEFQRVVAVVDEFSPRLEVLRPGACAISARGPARYFGGEEALAAKIIEAVAGSGYLCQAGVADGLFAARLAAQSAVPGQAVTVGAGRTRDFLARQPVSVLESPELADLLSRLGIRTLGEFASLPATQAANRFGTPGTVAHRLARGLVPRPLAPRPPVADLAVSVGFDPPERSAEPVVFAAKALAERMHAGTGRRSRGAGGTTGCCPRWRWPSGSAGSWPAGGTGCRPARTGGRPATTGRRPAGSRCCG
jgi:protein ImuB